MAMPAALRPMKLGEILDQGFSIYRRRIWLFAGITAIPALVMVALHIVDHTWIHLAKLVGPAEGRFDNFRISFLVWVAFSHVAGLIYPPFYPAIAKAASGVMFGEPATAIGALKSTAKRWRSWLWLDALKNCIVPFGVEVLGLGVLAACSFAVDTLHVDQEGNVMTVIAYFVLLVTVVASFWVGACLAFAVPAATLEGTAGFKAIRRSWGLSKRARFRVFLTWATVFILSTLIWFPILTLVRYCEWLLLGALHFRLAYLKVYLISYYVLSAIFSLLIAPIYPVIVIVLYYDQRVRKEGYDVERMIEAAGLTGPAPVPATEPPPTVGENPVGQNEPAGESIA
jgi:hypothetical protein